MAIYLLWVLQTSDGARVKEANRPAPLKKFIVGWLTRSESVDGGVRISPRVGEDGEPLRAKLTLKHVELEEDENLKRHLKLAKGVRVASETPISEQIYGVERNLAGEWVPVEIDKPASTPAQ